MNTHRRIALMPAMILGMALNVATPVWAQAPTDAPAAPPEPALSASNPLELTRSAADQVLQEIRQNRALYERDSEALFALVDRFIDELFDFETMSLLVLGPHWKSATEEQRQRFVAGFKNLLIRTYSRALLQAGNDPIIWEPLDLAPSDTRTIVNAKAKTASGDIGMSWRLRKTEAGWGVYDVVVDGISLVTNYRGSYTAEIRKIGLNGLIEKLEQRAAS